jgi:hypothetical protein
MSQEERSSSSNASIQSAAHNHHPDLFRGVHGIPARQGADMLSGQHKTSHIKPEPEADLDMPKSTSDIGPVLDSSAAYVVYPHKGEAKGQELICK